MDGEASSRRRAALGAALAGTGVALGAFGTHTLRSELDARHLEMFATGVQYQTLHGVAIVALTAVGVALGRSMWLATTAMAFGAVVFALSLYALALGAPTVLGAVAPIGGLGLMVGWGLAAWSLLRGESRS